MVWEHMPRNEPCRHVFLKKVIIGTLQLIVHPEVCLNTRIYGGRHKAKKKKGCHGRHIVFQAAIVRDFLKF